MEWCSMNYWIFQGNPRHKDKDDRYFDVTKYVLEEDVFDLGGSSKALC